MEGGGDVGMFSTSERRCVTCVPPFDGAAIAALQNAPTPSKRMRLGAIKLRTMRPVVCCFWPCLGPVSRVAVGRSPQRFASPIPRGSRIRSSIYQL